jgi:hypothetical protein
MVDMTFTGEQLQRNLQCNACATITTTTVAVAPGIQEKGADIIKEISFLTKNTSKS